MEVVVPPEISDKLSSKDISVSEGGQAKFFCSASGHPAPTITWRRNPEVRKMPNRKHVGANRKGWLFISAYSKYISIFYGVYKFLLDRYHFFIQFELIGNPEHKRRNTKNKIRVKQKTGRTTYGKEHHRSNYIHIN